MGLPLSTIEVNLSLNLVDQGVLPQKKSIKIKKLEKPSHNNFMSSVSGYQTNKAERKEYFSSNRPVSASTSKRNISNRHRKEDDFMAKSSSGRNLSKNVAYRKPASARPKRRNSNRAERNIAGISKILTSRIGYDNSYMKHRKVKVGQKNMMIGKGFTNR